MFASYSFSSETLGEIALRQTFGEREGRWEGERIKLVPAKSVKVLQEPKKIFGKPAKCYRSGFS